MEKELTYEEMNAIHNKSHYWLNREYHKEKNRRHYQENKDKIIARALARKDRIREKWGFPQRKPKVSRLDDDYIPPWLLPKTHE